MRRTIVLALCVLSCRFAAADDDPGLKEDLAALQGTWTTELRDDKGNTLVAVKQIEGNKEVYTLLNGQEVVLRREVEFRLSRLDNKVRVFTVTAVKGPDGADQRTLSGAGRSYLYKVEGDSFFEVEGLLVEGNLVAETYLVRWQRKPAEPVTGEASQLRPNTLWFQFWRGTGSGRAVVTLRAYDFLGSPACSRDGLWAAFDAYKLYSSSAQSEAECFVVRMDGTGLTRLATGATPRWSPSGQRLVFMREGRGDPDRDLGIFVINRDGTGEQRIGPGRWPDWSPDGTQIACSLGGLERGGARPGANIQILQVDGSGGHVLCQGDCPSWSPDGTKIACCRVAPGQQAPAIHVIDVATGEDLAIGPGWSRANWASDGKSLVCDGIVDGKEEMVRFALDDPAHPPEPIRLARGRGSSPCYAGDPDTIVAIQERPRIKLGDPPHTFDGRYDITNIDLTVAYLVPKDRKALVDWRERVDYFMGRIAAFHRRESGGRSTLRIQVHPEPLLARRTSEEIRGNDADQTFGNSLEEAQAALGWQGKGDGFPILLVLSEINWRELDDFQRTVTRDGVTRFEGARDETGRHFPGAPSGGARATYLPGHGMGLGLVSADGWRVPYSGSDCVIYHEGIGHPIGLPHPQPSDDSVMGLGQYHYWLSQSWVESAQKRALGWTGPASAGAVTSADLFTAFTALPSPIVPKSTQPVQLGFTWPDGARLRELKVRIQTDLFGPWVSLPVTVFGPQPPAAIALGSFDRPTPVSYRVDATLEDGQTVELWGYFKVESAGETSGPR
jgi:Tol biopolymer transport system component